MLVIINLSKWCWRLIFFSTNCYSKWSVIIINVLTVIVYAAIIIVCTARHSLNHSLFRWICSCCFFSLFHSLLAVAITGITRRIIIIITRMKFNVWSAYFPWLHTCMQSCHWQVILSSFYRYILIVFPCIKSKFNLFY